MHLVVNRVRLRHQLVLQLLLQFIHAASPDCRFDYTGGTSAQLPINLEVAAFAYCACALQSAVQNRRQFIRVKAKLRTKPVSHHRCLTNTSHLFPDRENLSLGLNAFSKASISPTISLCILESARATGLGSFCCDGDE